MSYGSTLYPAAPRDILLHAHAYVYWAHYYLLSKGGSAEMTTCLLEFDFYEWVNHTSPALGFLHDLINWIILEQEALRPDIDIVRPCTLTERIRLGITRVLQKKFHRLGTGLNGTKCVVISKRGDGKWWLFDPNGRGFPATL